MPGASTYLHRTRSHRSQYLAKSVCQAKKFTRHRSHIENVRLPSSFLLSLPSAILLLLGA